MKICTPIHKGKMFLLLKKPTTAGLTRGVVLSIQMNAKFQQGHALCATTELNRDITKNYKRHNGYLSEYGSSKTLPVLNHKDG